MTREQVTTNLCNYDLRNPEGVISYVSPEEIKADHRGNHRAEKVCYCDNCHRGKTELAEELLKYIK